MDPRENPLRAEKRKKLQRLKELGLNPFPHQFKPTHSVAQILAEHNAIAAGVQVPGTWVMAGRLMTKRDMGKPPFLTFKIKQEPCKAMCAWKS